MGDSTDGSSSAAQSAPHDSEPKMEKRGFFARLTQALSPENPDQPLPPMKDGPAQTQAPGLINLRRMRVEDVMVPSAEIIAVPVTMGRDELVQKFRDVGKTRLPVYDGTLDTPLGFVNLKDFALVHGFSDTGGGFDLRALVRDLLFVPPSMPLGVLLQKMQSDRVHIALVIDEYGGTDGLVTIEDLIEQVVGEIEDEHDADEAALWVAEKPGVYMAEARAPLAEFETEIGQTLTAHDEIDGEEIDSLGGLVFMLAGHVPARGEVIVHPEGPEFEVVEADPRRIKRLRVRLTGSVAG